MRYCIELSYIGKNYHGWQIQPNAITVQEVLEKTLSIIFREPVAIMGSSRTDTGVHAAQQFAQFTLKNTYKNLNKYLKRINITLPDDIAVKRIFPILPTQHVRFDATERKYIYRISTQKNPFFGGTFAYYYQNYDLDLMNEAAKLLLEYDDFECFSKVKTDVATFNCDIKEAFWVQNGAVLEFHIRANRFLRGMVRAIVGTLMDVGTGKISKADFERIILSKSRVQAGKAAKAQGLTLEEVNYPNEFFKPEFDLKFAEINDMDTVRNLFKEYQRGLGIDLCFQSFDEELQNLPGKYAEPKGCIILASHKDYFLGIVALKELEPGICEMKRLFIKPDYQGYGLGKTLALKLMEYAKNVGYKTMKLDTLARLESAVLLYRNLEFTETKPYNYNPEDDILYFEKEL